MESFQVILYLFCCCTFEKSIKLYYRYFSLFFCQEMVLMAKHREAEKSFWLFATILTKFLILTSKKTYSLQKYKGIYRETVFQLQINFDKRKGVSWHQLMFYIKWWVFLMILRPCLCMYNTFESHFDPFRLSKIGMAHPVPY